MNAVCFVGSAVSSSSTVTDLTAQSRIVTGVVFLSSWIPHVVACATTSSVFGRLLMAASTR
jgi:hypothetical protein